LVPRGSKLMMSKSVRSCAKSDLAKITKSTPEPPGPPGLTKMAPRRRGPVAGARTVASSRRAPRGRV
jgi:hypothetical protein